MRQGKLCFAVFFAGVGVCASGCSLLADFASVSDVPRDLGGTGGTNLGGGGSGGGGSGGDGGGGASIPAGYACDWAEDFGGSTGQAVAGLAVDVDGHVWLTGSYSGEIQFGEDPSLTSAGANDHNAFVAKLDGGTGKTLFSRGFGDAVDNQAGTGIAADRHGIFLAGRFGGDIDFGAPCGQISSGGSNNDVFMAALTTTGACVHKQGFAADATSPTAGLALDDGNVIIAIATNSSNGLFIRTHDTSLNVRGETGFSQAPGSSLKLDTHALVSQNNKLFLAGDFNGTVDPRGSEKPEDFLKSDGAPDAFVLGYNYLLLGNQGERQNLLLWGKGHGGAPSGSQSILAISNVAASSTDTVFVTGWFDTSMDLGDPSQTPFTALGGKDSFVAAMNVVDGKTRWSKQLGGSGDQSGTAVAFDLASKAVLVGGNFQGELELDSGSLQNSDGFDHVFLARFDDEGRYQWGESFGAEGAQAIQSIALLGSNVFITGTYKGALDFGCEEKLVNEGPADKIFVVRLKPVGF